MTYAELDVGREVLDALALEQWALDERGSDDALLASQTTEQEASELGTSVGHGEGGATGTVLSLDDLITTELDAVRELVELLLGEARRKRVRGLREQGNNLKEVRG